MAYTVEIYDPKTAATYDITDRTLEINVEEKLDNEVTTFHVQCKNIELPHDLNHVTIKKDGSLYLSGVILGQHDSDGGILDLKYTKFDCEGWGRILSKRIIADSYLSTGPTLGRPDLIIKDIISKSAAEFTATNVDQCNTAIESIQFPYVTPKEAIERVVELIPGWHWYVDKNKDVHLFYNFETDGIEFNETNINLKSLQVQRECQEHVNRVWIVGRKVASPTAIDVYYSADGNQRYFVLPYEPNETNIYVNGVLKDSSLEANDNGDRDFLINKIEKVFYTPSYKSPFTGTIRVNFKPTKQFIDMHENPGDIAVYGLMEKAIKNSNITDKLESRKYGSAEVKRQSTVIRKVTFGSRAQNVAIGQRVTLNVQHPPLWNVQGRFLVTSLRRIITPGDEKITFALEELV